MVKDTISILIKGKPPFQAEAEAELNVERLDPKNPPDEVDGRFIGFIGVEPHIAEFAIHADRADGGYSHLLFLFNGRQGYRFSMDAPDSLAFHAFWTRTGKVGFKR
jgi:hypothetical protein